MDANVVSLPRALSKLGYCSRTEVAVLIEAGRVRVNGRVAKLLTLRVHLVEDAITVDGGIVLLEGNYLLLDEEGWRDLRQYADYTIMIRAEEAMLRERLVRRRMQTGVPEKEAGEFVVYSDMVNVRTCLMRSAAADLTLQIDEEGDYSL